MAQDSKEVKKVQGRIKDKPKKQSFIRSFIAEDLEDVCSYILHSVIIPQVKTLIFQIIDNGSRRMLWGADASKQNKRNADVVSYNTYYDNKSAGQPKLYQGSTYRSKPSFNPEAIIFDTTEDAEVVIEQMQEAIAVYDCCTVAAFYDMANVPLDVPSGNNYGWVARDFDNYQIKIVNDVVDGQPGFSLRLPKAHPVR